MTEAQPCIFCGRSDQPMTREHVFARWLVQKVHGAKLVAGEARGADGPLRIARVFATVCARCNAGWMSALEVSFRRLVFAHPRTGALQAPDRTTLSRWAAKTAVLLAAAQGGELIAAAGRARLVTGMPDGIEVFVARRRRPPQRVDFRVELTAEGEADGVRAVGIQVDDLVTHVAQDAVLASGHGTRLWPLRTHALRWETLPVITTLMAPADRRRSPARRR